MQGNIIIEVPCKVCGIKFDLTVNPKNLEDWKNGNGFIQDIMPELSADERELLISGTCGRCFDEMFMLMDSTAEEQPEDF